MMLSTAARSRGVAGLSRMARLPPVVHLHEVARDRLVEGAGGEEPFVLERRHGRGDLEMRPRRRHRRLGLDPEAVAVAGEMDGLADRLPRGGRVFAADRQLAAQAMRDIGCDLVEALRRCTE